MTTQWKSVMTGVSLMGVGAAFILWMYGNFATSADLHVVRAEVSVVRTQVQDVLDARMEDVHRRIVQLEEKRQKTGELTPTEIDYLNMQRREYNRLKKLRYGEK